MEKPLDSDDIPHPDPGIFDGILTAFGRGHAPDGWLITISEFNLYTRHCRQLPMFQVASYVRYVR